MAAPTQKMPTKHKKIVPLWGKFTVVALGTGSFGTMEHEERMD